MSSVGTPCIAYHVTAKFDTDVTHLLIPERNGNSESLSFEGKNHILTSQLSQLLWPSPPNLFLSLSSPSQNTTPVIHKPRGLLWGMPPLPTAPCPQSFQCFVQNIALVHFSAVTTVVLVPSSPTQGIPTIVPSLHLSSTSFLQQPEGSTYCMNHLVSLPYIDPSNGILPLID